MKNLDKYSCFVISITHFRHLKLFWSYFFIRIKIFILDKQLIYQISIVSCFIYIAGNMYWGTLLSHVTVLCRMKLQIIFSIIWLKGKTFYLLKVFKLFENNLNFIWRNINFIVPHFSFIEMWIKDVEIKFYIW